MLVWPIFRYNRNEATLPQEGEFEIFMTPWLAFSISVSFSGLCNFVFCHLSSEIYWALDSWDGWLWAGVRACHAHPNSAWLPHPQCLPGASWSAAGERERSGAPGNSGSWSQTGNIGHLDLEMKYCCWGGRRVQTSKYRDAANSSGWAVTTTGREREARAGHASKAED